MYRQNNTGTHSFPRTLPKSRSVIDFTLVEIFILRCVIKLDVIRLSYKLKWTDNRNMYLNVSSMISVPAVIYKLLPSSAYILYELFYDGIK